VRSKGKVMTPVERKLYEALKEVVAISDRKHDAWDRAKEALLESAHNEETGDYVLVRKDVIAFLHGEADLDGKWFERPEGAGPWWWRKILRNATVAAPSPSHDKAGGWTRILNLPDGPPVEAGKTIYTFVNGEAWAYELPPVPSPNNSEGGG
jgi:hypothetical protein